MSRSKTDRSKEKINQPIKEQDLVKMFGEQSFEKQNKLKKRIIDLETSNQNYRLDLYNHNETVTKILENVNLRKGQIPILDNQLNVVAQQLLNVQKLIDIYKKQIKTFEKKQTAGDQMQTIAQSNIQVKTRENQLITIKRQIKNLQAKNKGMEYKLNQYSKRGKQKSVDSHGMMMKQAVQQNKVLKRKLQQIENNEKRKQQLNKNNYESAKQIKERVSYVLPNIQTARTESKQRERSTASLQKLQTQKKVYHKWFKNYIPKNFEKTEKQIEDFEKIKLLLNEKMQQLSEEIQQIQKLLKLKKQKTIPSELEKARNQNKKDEESKKKLKIGQCNCNTILKKTRRDWIGKFDGLRFSDSRHVRQQSRLFKIVHNNIGYYQFSYYSINNPTKISQCHVPFSISSVFKGKQTSFTVQYPDYVKSFKLRINSRTSKIVGMQVISNLGISCEFVDALEPLRPPQNQEDNSKQISYQMKININQAPTLMFGSYSIKYDQNKNIIGVHLQGLGVQLIQDFIEEKI